MELLPSELAAKEFVFEIGVERATRLLERICHRIERRAKRGSSFGQFLTTDYVKKADWEVSLIFNLKMGLKLLNNVNCPYAARQKVLARIEARKERSRLRKQGVM